MSNEKIKTSEKSLQNTFLCLHVIRFPSVPVDSSFKYLRQIHIFNGGKVEPEFTLFCGKVRILFGAILKNGSKSSRLTHFVSKFCGKYSIIKYEFHDY